MQDIGIPGLTRGRGGRDIYAKDWMTERSIIPEGKLIDTKLDTNVNSPYVGVRGVSGDEGFGGFDGLGITVRPAPPANGDQPVDEPGMLDFSRYWRMVKDTFGDIDGIGYKITLKLQQLGQIRGSLEAQGRADLVSAMQPDIDRVNNDLQTWWVCKGYVDEYKAIWTRAANAMGLSGLGFIMIPWLTVAILTALTYLAVHWLSLNSTYKYQTNVLDMVAAGTISAEAGATLTQESLKTTGGGVLDSIGSGIGSMATMAGIGILGYFLWSAYRGKSLL